MTPGAFPGLRSLPTRAGLTAPVQRAGERLRWTSTCCLRHMGWPAAIAPAIGSAAQLVTQYREDGLIHPVQCPTRAHANHAGWVTARSG